MEDALDLLSMFDLSYLLDIGPTYPPRKTSLTIKSRKSVRSNHIRASNCEIEHALSFISHVLGLRENSRMMKQEWRILKFNEDATQTLAAISTNYNTSDRM